MKTIGIIGGGPGGYVAAIKGAQLGAEVFLFEQDQVGGTCLNRGCIPTKTLLRSVEVLETVREAQAYGIKAENISFNLSQVIGRKEKVVSQLRQGVEGLLKANQVKVIKGKAVFKDPYTVQVDQGEEYRCDYYLIATGAKPALPNIPGIKGKEVFTSDEALALTHFPASLAIIGGGVIGLEFAAIFQAFGTKVTVLEALPTILPNVDEELSSLLAKEMRKKGMEIKTGVKVLEIADSSQGKKVFLEAGSQVKEIEGQAVLVAVGRVPETTGLNLEGIKIQFQGRGIKVDSYLRTNLPHIYAIGDVTGGIQLAHAASQAGERAVLNMLEKPEPMDYSIVPSCIYTSPEVACVGLREQEVQQKGLDYVVGRFPYRASGKALAYGEQTGLAKIIAEKKTGEILGAHLLGHNATELISELALAMKLEGTVEEVAELIHPHPTLAEIIKEAALDVGGHALHIPPRK